MSKRGIGLELWTCLSNGLAGISHLILENLAPHILLCHRTEILLMERSHCPSMLVIAPVHDYEHTQCANCHGTLDFHCMVA